MSTRNIIVNKDSFQKHYKGQVQSNKHKADIMSKFVKLEIRVILRNLKFPMLLYYTNRNIHICYKECWYSTNK